MEATSLVTESSLMASSNTVSNIMRTNNIRVIRKISKVAINKMHGSKVDTKASNNSNTKGSNNSIMVEPSNQTIKTKRSKLLSRSTYRRS